MPVTGNKTTGGTPPTWLGGREGGTRLVRCRAIGEESKAGGTAAAHPREQGTGQPGESGEHATDLGGEIDRGLGQVIPPRQQYLGEPEDVLRHRRQAPGLAERAAAGRKYRRRSQLPAPPS